MFHFRLCAAFAVFTAGVFAAPPAVRTVPWSPANPALPHETFAYRTITLKGVAGLEGPTIRATWNFGDGSRPETFTVEHGYDVSATHQYTGAVGAAYLATLTVEDTTTGESASSDYAISIREKSLELEVRVAIDEALWSLHKAMRRQPSETNAWNVLAFERQGRLASGDTADPYTETVAKALDALLLQNGDAPREAEWFEAVAVSGVPEARSALAKFAMAAASRRKLGLSNRQDTASQLLALTVAGVGRPDARWVRLETSLRNRNEFNLDTGALFELAQALRNHNVGSRPDPIQFIQSDAMGQLDWYAAETSLGASTNGVARTLLNRQAPDGSFTDVHDGTAKALLALRSPAVSVGVVNVTAQVSVTHTAWVFNRSTGKYTGALTVTNTSGSPIAGPLNAGLLSLPSGVVFANPTGTFNGAPYILIPGVVTLAVGGTASVQLQFTVTAGTAISYTPVIYSGAFPPAALSVGCPAGSGTLAIPYSSFITASGGAQAYTFSIAPGTLPHNLSLDAASGAVTGTPDIAGPVTFTANVNDSAGGTAQTAASSCTITIGTGNHAPTATSQSPSSNENVALPITLTGTDPDGDALSFSIVGTPTNGSLSAIGVVSCAGNPSTCTAGVTYTPNTNYNGPDSFTFKVNDGSLDSNIATVAITVNPVNQQPTANSQSVTTNQDTATPITLTGSDVETAPGNLTFTTTSTPSHGGLTGSGANRTYTPTAGYFGPDSFQFKVTDRGNPDACVGGPPACSAALDSTLATVTITVSPVNVAPTATPQSVTTNQDTAKAITLAGADSETLPANLTFNVTVNPSHGALTGTAPNVTYTPSAGYFGPDSFQFTVTDRGKPDGCTPVSTTCAAPLTSSAATVTITVSPVNTPPTANSQSVSALKNTPQAITLTGSDTETPPANLSFTVSLAPTHGALSGTAPNLTYTPTTGYTGADSFQFKVTDGGKPDGCTPVSSTCAATLQSTAATVTIAVNDPPQITSANNATFAPGKTGQSFTINTTGFPTGATMVIGQTGTRPTGVNFTDNHNGTGTIDGTPAAGTQGATGSPVSQAYPLTITANNGINPSASQSFTLNITCPVITVSGTAPLALIYNVGANSTYTQSAGNGTIVWSASGLPTNTSINSSTGNIGGTPNVTGTFAATITATDAGGCVGTKAVTVTVAPVAVTDSYSGMVDNTQALITGGTTVSPSTPFVSITGSVLINNDLPAGGIAATPATSATSGGGSVTIAADGTFIYTPPAHPSASAITSDTFTYTVVSNTGGGAAVTSAPATVNLALAGRVWYVKSGGSDSANNGQSQAPFLTFGKAATVSTANDTIYLYSGNDANLGAASLKQGQSLIGQGVALVVNSKTLVTAGSFPTLGGTLTASGITGLTVNGLSASTTGSPAVSLTNSDGTFTFKSVSTNGGTNGIVWNNSSAATGSFTVNGDGSNVALGGNSSGGTISGMSGADGAIAGSAIYLNNAHNVTLRRMTINGTNQNYGIRGTNVTGFTMEYSTVAGTNGNNASFFEGSVIFDGLFGTAAASTANSIKSSTIAGGWGDNFRLANTNGTSELTISNSTISNTNTGSNGNDNVHIDCHLTANITVHITGSTFAATNGDHIQTIADGTSHLTIVATGNTLSGGGGASALGQGITISGGDVNSSVDSTEVVRFNISNNNMTGTIQGGAININEGVGNGDWQGQVSGNTIGNAAVNGSGASQSTGIRVENHSKGTLTAIVHLNAVHQWRDAGINLQAGDTSATGLTNGPLNVTLTNNTVDSPLSPGLGGHGIQLNEGTQTSNTNLVCADLSSNDSLGDAANGGVDYRLRQRQLTTIRLPGYTGANNDNAAVRTYILGRPNTAHQASGSDVAAGNTVSTGGGGYTNTSPAGSQCTQPVVPN